MKNNEKTKEQLISELGASRKRVADLEALEVERKKAEEALREEVKMIKGLWPTCSGCERIRDENGIWWPLDAYVYHHTEAELTYTVCSDCENIDTGPIFPIL